MSSFVPSKLPHPDPNPEGNSWFPPTSPVLAFSLDEADGLSLKARRDPELEPTGGLGDLTAPVAKAGLLTRPGRHLPEKTVFHSHRGWPGAKLPFRSESG